MWSAAVFEPALPDRSTLTVVALLFFTNGQAAEIPATGECSPAKPHAHCRITSQSVFTAIDRLDVPGQGPHQPGDRGVADHPPEDLILAAQQSQVRQATASQGHAHRQVHDDPARIMHRPGPPRRQGPRELVAQPGDPNGLSQQPRLRQRSGCQCRLA